MCLGPPPRPSNFSPGATSHPHSLYGSSNVGLYIKDNCLCLWWEPSMLTHGVLRLPSSLSTAVKENFLLDYLALSSLSWGVLSLLDKVPGFCDRWVWIMGRGHLEEAGGKEWEDDETGEPCVVGLQKEQRQRTERKGFGDQKVQESYSFYEY